MDVPHVSFVLRLSKKLKYNYLTACLMSTRYSSFIIEYLNALHLPFYSVLTDVPSSLKIKDMITPILPAR